MFSNYLLSWLAFFVILSTTLGELTGYFWQLSDVHFDPDYSPNGDPTNKCHRNANSTRTAGFYGNYSCDSSWNLVVSVMKAMKKTDSKPDFILWTGDTVPHIPQKSVDKVYSLIRNITQKLRETFPAPLRIIPALGNHDAFPSNQMPLVAKDNSYYSNILSKGGWSTLLTIEEQKQFLKGGYYKRQFGSSSGLTFLVLNSNLWYSMNKLVAGHADPNNQLAWLKQELTTAQSLHYKVYIAAHVCPGSFERMQGMNWFYPEFNRKYVQLVQKFHNTISAHFCGHEHTDSFRILSDPNGAPSSVMFLSPALTPWKSTLPGVGANNPGVRLYHYTPTRVLNYKQYYMNLTAANSRSNSTGDLWQIEYDVLNTLSIHNCSANSFSSILRNMTNTSRVFMKYLQHNTVNYNMTTVCDSACFKAQICAILNIDLDKYKHCFNQKMTNHDQKTVTPINHPTPNSTNYDQMTVVPIVHPKRNSSNRHHHHHDHDKARPLPVYWYYIICSMGFVIVVLAVAVSCLCARQRHGNRPLFKYGRLVSTN